MLLVPEVVSSTLVKDPHFQTIYPTLFRKSSMPNLDGGDSERFILDTWDHDVLELQLLKQNSKKLIILCHGLEGSADGPYMSGMASKLFLAGWDVLRWSYRGCNGEVNKRLYTYHSGKTEDLGAVVHHVVNEFNYDEISLIGFSAGGNLSLKFLADYKTSLAQAITRTLSISAPLDLEDCSLELAKLKNIIYMKRFLKTLHHKICGRLERYPGALNIRQMKRHKNFLQFDDAFTGPLNGFTNAKDYWRSASAGPVLSEINQDFCILSSIDDPFLGKTCYPEKEALPSNGHSLYTRYGGHLGYMVRAFGDEERFWHEDFALHYMRAGTITMPPPILLEK